MSAKATPHAKVVQTFFGEEIQYQYKKRFFCEKEKLLSEFYAVDASVHIDEMKPRSQCKPCYIKTNGNAYKGIESL